MPCRALPRHVTFWSARRRGTVTWRAIQEDTVLTERPEAAKLKAAPEAIIAASDDKPGGQLLRLVLDSLEADKAEDVIPIALKGKSEMADYMVIASGRSSRQVQALAEKLSAQIQQSHDRSEVSPIKKPDWV